MDLTWYLMEYQKSFRFFQRFYVGQLGLFVSCLANKMKTICFLVCENHSVYEVTWHNLLNAFFNSMKTPHENRR